MEFQHRFSCKHGVRPFAVALCVIALSAVSASATPITFTGQDIVTTTGSPHPNSSAAAASFASAAAALGTVSMIDFEGAPLGSFSSLSAAPGVTVTGTDLYGGNQTIRNTSGSPAFPTLDGFNTTPGGASFLEMEGGTATFTFATPTQFFGAYFTGVQNFFTDYFTFSDGTTEVISLPEAGTSSSVGAVDFIGFTDAGKSISSVTINAGSYSQGADYIGVDDVSYQSAAHTSVTPEPDSILLMLTGCVGIAAGIRRRFSI